MKRVLFFIVIFSLLTSSVFCVRIDGKFWDWQDYDKEYKCNPHVLSKDRAGLQLEAVRLSLGRKCIYVMIAGRSVTGQKADKGLGFHRTSVRVSFSSAQSPLNRVRVLVDPKYPNEIKISTPYAETVALGNRKDKYWSSGKYSGSYAFEVKVPTFISSKGIHVGSKQGPLLRMEDDLSTRKRLSDILVNTVDSSTHRLVSTAVFSIKRGDL